MNHDSSDKKKASKKSYQPPALTRHGNVGQLTTAGSNMGMEMISMGMVMMAMRMP